MEVAKLHIDSETIRGQPMGDTYCNPVQDLNDNWIISIFEASYLSNSEYEIVEWIPKLEI